MRKCGANARCALERETARKCGVFNSPSFRVGRRPVCVVRGGAAGVRGEEVASRYR